MIVVTGGAGFIGSNLVRRLQASGRDDVVVVDDLSDSAKFENLVGTRVADYLDKREFVELLRSGAPRLADVDAVLHQGACSSTTEPDGRYVMENNLEYSISLFDACRARGIRLVYASSAAVYGDSVGWSETPDCERPLNVYAFSKLLFDQHVRRALASGARDVVGLRYFNVYGPGEEHKGSMASIVRTFAEQLRVGGAVRPFGASHGLGDGEQARDFVHVDDVVDVVLWSLSTREVSGIFNCGTGTARTFNEVASLVLDHHGRGSLEYVPFPDELAPRYQARTKADLSRLRAAGYRREFLPIEVGVPRYLAQRDVPRAPRPPSVPTPAGVTCGRVRCHVLSLRCRRTPFGPPRSSDWASWWRRWHGSCGPVTSAPSTWTRRAGSPRRCASTGPSAPTRCRWCRRCSAPTTGRSCRCWPCRSWRSDPIRW